MSLIFSDVSAGPLGQFKATRLTHPVDIWVGTPMKVLEMVHGWGWDRRRWKMVLMRQYQLALSDIRLPYSYSILDLFFQEPTRNLLADISSARGFDAHYTINCTL